MNKIYDSDDDIPLHIEDKIEKEDNESLCIDDNNFNLHYSDEEKEFESNDDDDDINININDEISEYSESEIDKNENEIKEINENELKEINDSEKLIVSCSNCKINDELLTIIKNMDNKITNLENMIICLMSQNKNMNEFEDKKKLSKNTPNKLINEDENEYNEIPELTKKTNILEWLNLYIRPFQSFEQFIQNIDVRISHFECLTEYKISDVVQKIIQLNFPKKLDKKIYPFYSTSIKSGKVYVYTDKDDWELISLDYLCKFVNVIQNKLYKLCIQYQTKYCSKEGIEKAQFAISKLSSIKYTQDTFMNRVRADLHDHLRTIYRGHF
jgi:hypothetical protein